MWRRATGRSAVDKGIGRISSILVALVVLCTGAASYSYLHDLLVSDRSAILEAELERRAEQLTMPLQSGLETVKALAARNHSARALRIYQSEGSSATDLTMALLTLQGAAANLVRGGGLRAAEIQSLDGYKIASSGHMRELPEMSVALPGDRATLYWENGFHIRVRNPIAGDDGRAGTLVADLTLEDSDRALAITPRMGETGEVAVCGISEGSKICFPTRFRPEGRMAEIGPTSSLPSDRALFGQRGTRRVEDHRGMTTYSSFKPLHGLNLALVVKMDESELLAPVRRHLTVGVPLLILLAAAGALLVRLQLRPLTKELVDARRQAEAEVASRTAAESEMGLANRRLRMVADGVSVLIAFLDPKFVYRFANRAHLQWFQRPLDQILGQPMAQLVGPVKFQEYELAMSAARATRIPQSVLRETSNGNETRYFEVTFVAQLDDDQALEGYCITERDATESVMREQMLLLAARRDPLTGLCNRISFNERLDAALHRPTEDAPSLAVAYLDLDYFKKVNDNHGHDVGDEMLKVVAQRLLATLKSSDTVARLGGDEFALILPDLVAGDDVYRIGTRLLETLRRPVTIEGHPIRVSASIGFAVAAAGDSTASLLSRADKALYRVKRQGRDGVLRNDSPVEAEAVMSPQMQDART